MANIAIGSASAIIALILPPILVRWLPKDVFGTWSLVLQVGAYVGFLNFGIQTAVGRYVSHYTALGDIKERDRLVSTAFIMLTIAAIVAMLIISIVGLFISELFRQMPITLVFDARVATIIVGFTLAVGLPFSVFAAVFVGQLRNSIPAKIQIISKLMLGVGLAVTAYCGGRLIALSVIYAVINVLAYVWQFLLFKKEAPDYNLSIRNASYRQAKGIFEFCISLTVWNLAMLMVQGLDTTIVGIFDFQALAYYSLAVTLVLFSGGLHSAIIAPLLPSATALAAVNSSCSMGDLLIVSTRRSSLILLTLAVPIMSYPIPILSLWVGVDYAREIAPILIVVMLGTILRLTATPYAMLLVATGRQQLIIWTPLVAGIINLASSVILSRMYGAIGVALGTLIGSLVELIGHWWINVPRTADQITFTREIFFVEGYGRPLLCFIPFFVMPLLDMLTGQTLNPWFSIISATSVTILLVLVIGLSAFEKEWLRNKFIGLISQLLPKRYDRQ
jgi:O-antigen/teichoic acid export membrane protein